MKYLRFIPILLLPILLIGCKLFSYSLEGSIQSNKIELPFTYFHDSGSRVSDDLVEMLAEILETVVGENIE